MSTEYSVALKLQANTSVIDQLNTKLLTVARRVNQLSQLQVKTNVDTNGITAFEKQLNIRSKQLDIARQINTELTRENSLMNRISQRQRVASGGRSTLSNRGEARNLATAQAQADRVAGAFDRIASAQNNAFSSSGLIAQAAQNLQGLATQALAATAQVDALATQMQRVSVAAQAGGPASGAAEGDLRQQNSLLQSQLDALVAMQQVVRNTVQDRQEQLEIERQINREQQNGGAAPIRRNRQPVAVVPPMAVSPVVVPPVVVPPVVVPPVVVPPIAGPIAGAVAATNQVAASAGAVTGQLQAAGAAAQALAPALAPANNLIAQLKAAIIRSIAALRTEERLLSAIEKIERARNREADRAARNQQRRAGIAAGVGAALATANIPGQQIFQAGAIGGRIGGPTGAIAGVAAGSAIALGGFMAMSAQTSITVETLRQRLGFLSAGFDDHSAVLATAAQMGKKYGQSQAESMDAFAKAYARLRPMGMSLDQITTIYDGFNTASKLAGTSTAETAGAFTQLLQAMGSGALRGEELNSVLEQAPLLAQGIAKALGTTVGKLKVFAEQGLITGDIVLKALTKIRDDGTGKLAKAMQSPAQKVQDLGIAFEGLQIAATSALVPAIVNILEGMTGALKDATPAVVGMAKGFASLVGAIGNIVNFLKMIPKPITDAAGFLLTLTAQTYALSFAYQVLMGLGVSLKAFFVSVSAQAVATGAASLTAAAGVSALQAALFKLGAIGVVAVGIHLIIKEIGDLGKFISDAGKNKKLKERQDQGGAAKVFQGSSRDTVVAAQKIQTKELEKILEEKKQITNDLTKVNDDILGLLFDPNQSAKQGALMNKALNNQLREKFARGVMGLDPNKFEQGKANEAANYDGSGDMRKQEKAKEDALDRAEAVRRAGTQLDRQTQDLRIQTEDQIFGLRRRAEELTRSNIDLRRSVESDIFEQQQTIARLNSDNLRARDQLKADRLDARIDGMQLNTAIPGAEMANTLLSAVKQYVSARSNAEADLRAKERTFAVEMVDLKKAMGNYSFELNRKIGEMNRQSLDYTKDVEKAKLTAERAIYDWQIASADYQLAKARERLEVEREAAALLATEQAAAGNATGAGGASAGAGAAGLEAGIERIKAAYSFRGTTLQNNKKKGDYQSSPTENFFFDFENRAGIDKAKKRVKSLTIADIAALTLTVLTESGGSATGNMDVGANLISRSAKAGNVPISKIAAAKGQYEGVFKRKLTPAQLEDPAVGRKLFGAQYDKLYKTFSGSGEAPTGATAATTRATGAVTGFTPQQIQAATQAASKFTGITNMCALTVKAFYASLGKTLPGVDAAAKSTEKVGTIMRDWSKLQIGDIVNTGKVGDPLHTGVYTGGKNVFHQSSVRGKKAGNFPDLNVFKKDGYFIRPNTTDSGVASARTGSNAASASAAAAAAKAAGNVPSLANTMAAFNNLKAPAPIDFTQLIAMKGTLDASLIAAKELGLALAKDFALMSKENAAATLSKTVEAEITKLTAPLEAITKAQADQAAYQREYGNLISQGIGTALADQLIKIDQQVALQLQQLDVSTASLETLKTTLLASGQWTVELQKQLDLLYLQKSVIPAQGKAATAGAKAAETPKTKLGTAITEAQGQLNEIMNPINQIKGGAAAIGTAFSDSFRGVVTGAMTAEQALQNMFQRTADHFLDMAAQMIAKMIELQAMKLIMSIVGGGPGAAAGGGLGEGLAGFTMGPIAEGFGLGGGGGGRAFAAGGIPPVGVPSLIGEKGPELFIPGQSGLVVPNDIFAATRQAIENGSTGSPDGVAFAENEQAITSSSNINRERQVQQDYANSMQNGYEPINVKVDAFDPAAAGLVTMGQLEKSNRMAVAQAQAKIMNKFKNNPSARAGAGLR